MFDTLLKKLEESYDNFKINPRINIKSFFCIPFYLFFYIKRRWKTEKNILYLTETEFKNHPLTKREIEEDYSFKIYTNYLETETVLFNRMIEDNLEQHYLKEVKRRFLNGDYMITLEYDNKCVSYLFISEKFAYLSQIDHKIRLNNKIIAIYDVYTFQNFRGKNFYEKLITYVFKLFETKGFEKCWLWVMPHNKVSIKVHSKLSIDKVRWIFEGQRKYFFKLIKKKEVDFKLADLI